MLHAFQRLIIFHLPLKTSANPFLLEFFWMIHNKRLQYHQTHPAESSQQALQAWCQTHLVWISANMKIQQSIYNLGFILLRFLYQLCFYLPWCTNHVWCEIWAYFRGIRRLLCIGKTAIYSSLPSSPTY